MNNQPHPADIDKQIAKIMAIKCGWIEDEHRYLIWYDAPDETQRRLFTGRETAWFCWSPSTNIVHAWELIEAAQEEGVWFSCAYATAVFTDDLDKFGYCVQFRSCSNDIDSCGVADTFPMAVCLSFIDAFGVKP